MALTSSIHTMPNNTGSSSSSNSFLLPKNDLTMADNQLIDILLHGQSSEIKIQIVNHWCKNARRSRLSNILDVSQRHDALLSLINTLQQTTNTEYQYNCLTLLSEIQTNIHHYDQRIYLPAIIQCFSSTSTEVQTLTCQLLIKQLHTTNDIPTFLYIYTQDGLKSSNIRICIKSIEIIQDLLAKTHQHENLSPIFEILLEYLQDSKFRLNYNQILLRAIQHIRRILSPELLNTYLDSYSSTLKRLYYTYVSQQNDVALEDDDQTPRASIQVSQIKGSNGFRSTINSSSETSDIYSLLETMRAKWMSSNETIRLNYLDRLKSSCDKHIQYLNSQYSSKTDSQLYQNLYQFYTSILELLSYITSTNLELSIKIKLILSTCLGWLIKHAQGNFCKKHYKILCTIFKNILLNGQSNNRQLAKFSVSLILLLENFVQPQLILNELIDDQFQYYNYRIQLELLAIVTATLIKHRQSHYDTLSTTYKQLLPMLASNRRELRHGAMECFTVICTYYNSYKSLSINVIETNQSIKLLLSIVENLSYDASNALRFRLQRNILPLLTDEGNITPGLVCDATTINDPDAKFILMVNNNNNQNSISSASTTHDRSSTPPLTTKLAANNSKLLQLAMPFAAKKSTTNEKVMRTREIPPIKPPDVDIDSHRYNPTNNNNNNNHYETSLNRQQRQQLSKQLNLSSKHQTSIATGGPTVDLSTNGSHSYRPLTFTEKVFTDDWAKKLSTNNQRKEPITNVQQQENNTVQIRPAIPRRSSLTRVPASHHLLVTSQIHNHQEQQNYPSNLDHEETIDSAIESHSLSINTSDDRLNQNNHHQQQQQQSNKSIRSVHSSSTRRKANRLFNNGNDLDTSSARTLTSENNNESGVYSQSGRDTDYETNGANRSIGKDQLFSTKPRLARSGSKSKLDRSQLPPTDSSLFEQNSNEKSHRFNNVHVEVVGRGYVDEKHSTKRSSNENLDQPVHTKPRTKIMKASVVTNPSNTNNNMEDDSRHHDEDIGVIGKAVKMPIRSMQNNKENENIQTVSDEFDSDSKDNDTAVDMNQSLSASFRLRVQQKTQEKIEQKERRRQDRENRIRQQQLNNNSDAIYDNDPTFSSTSTSRYSSQPDLTNLANDLPLTPKRQMDSNINSILPNFPSQQRLRLYKNSMSRSQTFNNRRDSPGTDQRMAFNRPSSEDRTIDPLRNPLHVYREAMESIGNDDWEQKCSGLSLIQILIAQYPETITQNLHQIVLVLIQEVKNLRSQVARFALSTFSEMFKHLKRNMDIELDLTVKALIQKSAESNEFFRSDTEKCLQMMIDNVTLQKALQALIAGGASHRNPAARKTSAKYIYLVCEKIGPTKILSGIRDITERVLQVAATFASDGPPEIRWYGKKIYHMLMSYDELDSMMKHYLNPTAYTNMCEILDNIRAKGGVGETPSESARNVRRTLSNDKLMSNGSLTNQFSSTRRINTADQAEQVRDLTKQMRSSDFRERLNGIEEFQKLCELETNTAIQSIVPIFDGFNECLADMNSKVVLKALNTMHQLVPILGDALSSVINSALPLVAQNIASKNRDISQLASDIIDTAIEYIDCGVLIQPLCTLSQNSNPRVRPEIVLKLAALVPQVCQRKPKQVEIHLLPTYWKLLSLLRGQNSTAISSSAGGSNSLNSSIHVLTMALYTELGTLLIDRASSSSLVTPKNLQLLRELCTNIDAE